ncbi:DUF2635 domain-containing protein [Methylobacterium fujisawaense]|uniref:DUF2635 domain-containing protein n=1 Tax=Methylobacterium fujisawaense TaxID=107400 RepID=UPI00313B6ECC
MRKHVKPAHPNATIPDPERRGDLSPEGRVVPWGVHWARLAARGDIVVTDVPEAAEAPQDPPPVIDSEAPEDAPQSDPSGEPAADPAPEAHPDA